MKTYLRKTKIVGTIGPASENKLPELFKAGLNVCRVNYSHGSYDEQKEKTETIIKLREELELPIPMILDMQGPEIRTWTKIRISKRRYYRRQRQSFSFL